MCASQRRNIAKLIFHLLAVLCSLSQRERESGRAGESAAKLSGSQPVTATTKTAPNQSGAFWQRLLPLLSS